MGFILLAALGGGAPSETPAPPPALRKGDAVGITAPASPLHADQVGAAAANLRKRGFTVKVAGDPTRRRGYLAGDDEARAAALNALIRDPDVKAIVCARGGYGSPRILDQVDYEALRRDPKILIGYSDATALLIAARQRSGIITFHGPMAKELGWGRGLTPFAEKYYWSLLSDPESPLLANWGGERPPGMKPPTTLVEGRAEGVLTGGNLSVLCAALGTPFEVDARDSILFIEEVGEKPFRIDRMLNQLRLSGKLRQARGILLGIFAGCDTRDPEGDLALADVFADYFRPLGVPVLSEYPAGHVADQVLLPLGVRVRLDADAKTLAILSAPVAASPPAAREAGEGR